MAACNLASYFLIGKQNTESMALISMLLISTMGAYVIVNIEKMMHNSFLKECLEGNVKKQNLDRFILALIS